MHAVNRIFNLIVEFSLFRLIACHRCKQPHSFWMGCEDERKIQWIFKMMWKLGNECPCHTNRHTLSLHLLLTSWHQREKKKRQINDCSKCEECRRRAHKSHHHLHQKHLFMQIKFSILCIPFRCAVVTVYDSRCVINKRYILDAKFCALAIYFRCFFVVVAILYCFSHFLTVFCFSPSLSCCIRVFLFIRL